MIDIDALARDAADALRSTAGDLDPPDLAPRRSGAAVVTALVVLVLIAVGISRSIGGGADVETDPVGVDETPAPEIGPTTSRPVVVELPETTLPLSDDPCASPAAHQVGGDAVEYNFELNGDAPRFGVRIGGEDALGPEPTVVMMLSPPGGGWISSAGLADFIGGEIGPEASRIVVAPQPGDSTAVAWTLSPSFNIDYLETLFDLLRGSFCLDGARIVLGGVGEATIAVAQVICSTDLEFDLAYFQLGLVTLQECEPSRAVPILSIGRFGLETPIGPHWDGFWEPRADVELELTGGFVSDPDAVEAWAEVYGCTDEVASETLPDPDGLLEQPTVALSHRECDAPIVAFGLEPTPGDFGIDDNALVGAAARLNVEWNGLLDGSDA